MNGFNSKYTLKITHDPLHHFTNTVKKWRFSFRIYSVNVDLVTFTEEILNGKLHFLCIKIEYLSRNHLSITFS